MTPEEFKHYPKEIQEAVEQAHHSVKRKQKERKVRKQRKKLRSLKAFIRLLLIFLLVAATYKLLKLRGWYLSQTAFSKPETELVQVINNKIVPTDLIYKQIKDIKVTDSPIFLMRVDPIKKELLKIPVFKNVYVRRYAFPARVDIILKERIPAAVIKIDLKAKPIAFVTTDGVLITNKNYMALSETKSAIKILVANPKIEKDWTVKRVEHIEKIVRTVEAYSSEKVHYIDMRNPNDVFVRIDSTNIRLGLLDSTVFDRIKRIYTILPQIDEVEGTIKYVDLSWDKVNYFKLQKTEQK